MHTRPPYPTHAQDACDRLEACAGYSFGARFGYCATYGKGLLEGGTPPGWSYSSGSGGTDLLTTGSGGTDQRCHRKRPGGACAVQ